MINLVRKTNPMPEQAPEIRVNNFDEVSTGYTEDMAIREAMRCLRCRKKPCMLQGCPTQMRIPEFIAKVAEGDFEEAYNIVTSVSVLPSICSRVCPHENQCQGSCVHGIKGEPVKIGAIERFIVEWHKANCKEAPVKAEPNGHKAAVIGSGPAGITCASDLADAGVDVTIYESLPQTGGILTYGIPEFRLPNAIVEEELDKLKAKGVKFVTGVEIGKDMTVADLMSKEGYETVFIGNGADVPAAMGIPGEDLKGVWTANDYLTAVNIGKAYLEENKGVLPEYKKVAVVGGGNVAMDAARCALRMGAESVKILYRRSREEMPACNAEIEEAEVENVEFCYLMTPVEIKGDAEGNVSKIECVKMELGEPDSSGRRRPVPVEGSNFELDVDAVIMAIGTRPSKVITGTTEGIEINKAGRILTDDANATACAGVFAGGDSVGGPITVVMAMRSARNAAKNMIQYMNK